MQQQEHSSVSLSYLIYLWMNKLFNSFYLFVCGETFAFWNEISWPGREIFKVFSRSIYMHARAHVHIHI